MKKINGSLVVLATCLVAAVASTGCNTVRGAGKDIQHGGKAVENAADNTQEKRGYHHAGTHQHTISASAERGGAISPAGEINVKNKSSQTFYVKADNGFQVANVMVDGRSVGAVNSHKFTDVTEGHSIAAQFTSNSR